MVILKMKYMDRNLLPYAFYAENTCASCASHHHLDCV
jgi:hypothetical protein